MLVTITRRQRVYEFVEFEAEIPDGVDPSEYVEEHYNRLEKEAEVKGTAHEADTDYGQAEIEVSDSEGNALGGFHA